MNGRSADPHAFRARRGCGWQEHRGRGWSGRTRPGPALGLLACAIGGGAAGLAGAIEVLAVHGAASESLIVGFGYTGILVAFLARQNPLAIVPVALLVGGITASGGLLQRRFGMPDATTQVLEGLIFLCVLASNALAGRTWFARGR